MNCPQCKDFDENSDKYAIDILSKEIAVIADNYAKEKAIRSENYIDYYMLHYRMEYSRLLNERKHRAKESYNDILDKKYESCPNLCVFCKKDKFVFDDKIGFCFHEKDKTCENCEKKFDYCRNPFD
jgi:L-lysine 2,3-aminomutase